MTSSEGGQEEEEGAAHALIMGGEEGFQRGRLCRSPPSTSAEFPEFSVLETQGRAQWWPCSQESTSAGDSER